MQLTNIILALEEIPSGIKPYVSEATIFDSSCSERAKTYFIQKDQGYFLKIAPVGTLRHEAIMMDYFHKKGVTSRVLAYESETNDFLLTESVIGQDCTEQKYLDKPEKLCDVISESLRMLHDSDCSDCPFTGVTSAMIPLAHQKYHSNDYDAWMLEYVDFDSPAKGYEFLLSHENILCEDVHLHGDACLPNILLHDFQFSGFIDFDGGGIGDRHFDLFWAVWSLQFNLKTNQYKDRFLDGYGRDLFDLDRYRLCGVLQSFTY